MKVKQILFVSRPKGLPTMENFTTTETTLPEIAAGEVLLKPVYFSVDPYMRGRMNDEKSYIPPFQTGQPMEGAGVAEVVESKDPDYKAGDLVMPGSTRPFLPWATGVIFSGKDLRKLDTSIPASYYLGILGITGLTAYFGLMDIGKPKPGETVVVSGAAGAVGLVVGQLAKLQGCRVVGIAGGPEKVKMLTDTFNFDVAIDYKNNHKLATSIASACPNGVDIYFDNVGGEISDAVIKHLNFFARVPLCGQIALYNSTEEPVGPRIQPYLLTRSILMQGFTMVNYTARLGEGIQYIAPLVKAGKLKSQETVVEGFDHLPTALLGLFSGKNNGKMVVKV
ncbi:NADP-dependent oxidoreductase [Chitinophaga nivalis]|uniref:NADP-dependent oxidoreductase n=1 Tax=Chitinophaga nivalis TaxID=2991709 RepID=A0ABT3IL30_9BACT|nr:NADP-dependent oxidoreductase [Chitinophaga nivalis]MCW3465651.1 NADP-dependent oxidoreductase [Chitinophaga nivalis]MCW3484658.1 NADP-dependent oxidoreductase [Chitinophaga nivalis]